MSTHTATATAGSNIAFVKYWGNMNDALRIPMNGSLSMTLDKATTRTTVEFGPFEADELILNDEKADEKATLRASHHLDHLRKMANTDLRCRVVSHNSFPTGAGIASSASGFAALTVAAAGALGLDLSNEALSKTARLGSGSASRSIDGGFVEWQQGGTHDSSYATQIASADHWDLVDVIAIISTGHKAVGSTGGHPLAHTSPFYRARLGELQTMLPKVRQALLEKDLQTFGTLIEEEAISLHIAAMSSRPSVLYWEAGTMALLQGLRRWRADGSAEGYFTLDAGPNVHIITTRDKANRVLEMLKTVPEVQDTLVCGPGEGAKLL